MTWCWGWRQLHLELQAAFCNQGWFLIWTPQHRTQKTVLVTIFSSPIAGHNEHHSRAQERRELIPRKGSCHGHKGWFLTELYWERGPWGACWAYGFTYRRKFKVTSWLQWKKKKALFTNHRTVLQNSPVVSNSFPVFGLYLKLPLRKAQLESKVLSASDHQSSRGAKVKWRSAKAEVSSFQTHNSHLHTPFPSGDPGVGSQWVANALCPKKRRKITHTYT